jgi:hypothetical protein
MFFLFLLIIHFKNPVRLRIIYIFSLFALINNQNICKIYVEDFSISISDFEPTPNETIKNYSSLTRALSAINDSDSSSKEAILELRTYKLLSNLERTIKKIKK